MNNWPKEVLDAETQEREIEAQRKHIQKHMREMDEQSKQLLDNDYFLFFGEANK